MKSPNLIAVETEFRKRIREWIVVAEKFIGDLSDQHCAENKKFLDKKNKDLQEQFLQSYGDCMIKNPFYHCSKSFLEEVEKILNPSALDAEIQKIKDKIAAVRDEIKIQNVFIVEPEMRRAARWSIFNDEIKLKELARSLNDIEPNRTRDKECSARFIEFMYELSVPGFGERAAAIKAVKEEPSSSLNPNTFLNFIKSDNSKGLRVD